MNKRRAEACVFIFLGTFFPIQAGQRLSQADPVGPLVADFADTTDPGKFIL